MHLPDQQSPEKMLFFLGYSRSGHSLVGALLDAHPEIVVSHELHALKHLANGCSTAQTVMAIKYNAYLYHLLGREYTGYDYQVPGQAQGAYRRLRIAGDKKGNGTVRLLRRRPDLLDQLEHRFGRAFIFVHVVRNPYDNIASKARRTGVDLATAAQRYFVNTDVIARLKRNYPTRIVDVYLDDLIHAPERTLRFLLDALGISHVPATYYAACAAILFKQPRRSARGAQWPKQLLNTIREQVDTYPFLKRFRGEDAQP